MKVEVYWHCLQYAEGMDPFYYIIAFYQGGRASCEVRGIVSLLEAVPIVVQELRAAVQCNGAIMGVISTVVWG